MSSEITKGEIEKTIFLDFINKSELHIELNSVEKRSPPEPDLLCKYTTGEIITFELVELCDPNIASAPSRASREETGVLFLRTQDPSRFILQKKLSKTYQTDYPIDLLCYTNGRVIAPDDYIVSSLKDTMLEYKTTFQRIWFLGNNCVQIY